MDCPSCQSPDTKPQSTTSELGYQRFRCRACGRRFNERTGTDYNFLEYPTDVVLLVLFHRIRYALSFREVAEMFLLRGFSISHETVRLWEARFAESLGGHVRARRHLRCPPGKHWFADETYVKIKGQWAYLYRAIDSAGNLVDSMLSKNRDMAAAKRLFRGALKKTGEPPTRVTTDGHTSYPRAIEEELGAEVEHRKVGCTANLIEQDHRGIKRRYRPMTGFKTFKAASRFCTTYDELRAFFRPRDVLCQELSAPERRSRFLSRFSELEELILAI